MSKATAIESRASVELKPISRSIISSVSVGEEDTDSVVPVDQQQQQPAADKKKLMFKKSWLFWWNSEEWWSCWIGLIFFGCIAPAVKQGIPSPEFLRWSKNPFSTFATHGNYALPVICVAMGLLLWLSMAATKTVNWKKFPYGYSIVFLIALISKMLASNEILKKGSIGDSIWAIILGCLLRNVISFFTKQSALPPWLKVAQQTELYIAISLVLLCIDFEVLKPLAPRALFVSWLDTPTLFLVVAYFGTKVLKIETQTSIIMSGATFICGSSAAIALASSMGVPHKTDMPIAIISIFTIPSIIALPYIAKSLDFSPTVSGAWFGGCVDSTGAVIAAASIYGDQDAINTSAVVKMIQNVLIGPLSVLMAWGWSRYELQEAYKNEESLILQRPDQDLVDEGIVQNNREFEDSNTPSVKHPRNLHGSSKPKERAHVLLWKRFPKFVIGFIITAVLFNTTIDSDIEIRSQVNEYCFYVAEWFSTLSFVSIGMGLQFNDLRNNISSLGKLVTLYIVAQLVDIVATGILAWAAFTYL